MSFKKDELKETYYSQTSKKIKKEFWKQEK